MTTTLADWECAECGKEFWTDDQPFRCTACKSFRIVRIDKGPSHIEKVQTMLNGETKVVATIAPASAPEPKGRHGRAPRPVVCVETGQRYEGAKAAAAAVGCHPSAILRAIKAGGECKGHRWRFDGEAPKAAPKAPRKAKPVQAQPAKPVPTPEAARAVVTDKGQLLRVLLEKLAESTPEQIVAAVEWVWRLDSAKVRMVNGEPRIV